MRKALVIFLLALLPFQFVWGAAAEYCQHEQGNGVSHFGHHPHKHHVKASGGDTSPDKKGLTGVDDADCISCHMGCAAPLAPDVPVGPGLDGTTQGVATVPSVLPGLVIASIDRPKWASPS